MTTSNPDQGIGEGMSSEKSAAKIAQLSPLRRSVLHKFISTLERGEKPQRRSIKQDLAWIAELECKDREAGKGVSS